MPLDSLNPKNQIEPLVQSFLVSEQSQITDGITKVILQALPSPDKVMVAVEDAIAGKIKEEGESVAADAVKASVETLFPAALIGMTPDIWKLLRPEFDRISPDLQKAAKLVGPPLQAEIDRLSASVFQPIEAKAEELARAALRNLVQQIVVALTPIASRIIADILGALAELLAKLVSAIVATIQEIINRTVLLVVAALNHIIAKLAMLVTNIMKWVCCKVIETVLLSVMKVVFDCLLDLLGFGLIPTSGAWADTRNSLPSTC